MWWGILGMFLLGCVDLFFAFCWGRRGKSFLLFKEVAFFFKKKKGSSSHSHLQTRKLKHLIIQRITYCTRKKLWKGDNQVNFASKIACLILKNFTFGQKTVKYERKSNWNHSNFEAHRCFFSTSSRAKNGSCSWSRQGLLTQSHDAVSAEHAAIKSTVPGNTTWRWLSQK